jgi:hypothetical protein
MSSASERAPEKIGGAWGQQEGVGADDSAWILTKKTPSRVGERRERKVVVVW